MGSTVFEGGNTKKSTLPIPQILCGMGLLVGAGLGIVHHGPEMLSFMGCDGGAELGTGIDGTADATGVAASKAGNAPLDFAPLDNAPLDDPPLDLPLTDA